MGRGTKNRDRQHDQRNPDDGLAAVLIQIAAHAEQISGLDTRERRSLPADRQPSYGDSHVEATSANARIDAMTPSSAARPPWSTRSAALTSQVAALAREHRPTRRGDEGDERTRWPTGRAARRDGGS